MTRYGMRHDTIRYFQQQARSLNYYNGLRRTELPRNWATQPARELAHTVIGMAFVLRPAELKAAIASAR